VGNIKRHSENIYVKQITIYSSRIIKMQILGKSTLSIKELCIIKVLGKIKNDEKGIFMYNLYIKTIILLF